jgi:hypothetical protein
MVTAQSLLPRVRELRVRVEAGDLVFATVPSAELQRLLVVLHTGVRACLVGRVWWCILAGNKPRMLELRPDQPLPRDAELLCVEGDSRWDRVHPHAKHDLPQLFQRSAKTDYESVLQRNTRPTKNSNEITRS